MKMENIVSNAQKGFNKLRGIFSKSNRTTQSTESKDSSTTKKKVENSTNNMTIKESSSNTQLNFDLDDDDIHSSPSPSPKSSPPVEVTLPIYSEKEEDIFQIAHRVFHKKQMIDIEQMPYVPFIKMKKVENVLTIMGFGPSRPKYKEIKYLALFDEDFIYMINMTHKENNQNNFNKKIGNHYDLKMITNIDIKDDPDGKKCITLLFILDNNIDTFKSKVKEFHFEYENAVKFFNMLKYYLSKFNIPLNYKNEEFAKMNATTISNTSISVTA